MKSQNHQTWKIVFCRPSSTKKGLWTQPPKKENDHARVVCMCVYVFFRVFCTVLKPKPATQKQNLLLKVVEDSCCDVSKKHGWFCLHLSTSPKKYSPSVSLKLQIPVVRWFPRTRVLPCEKMTQGLSLSLSLPPSLQKNLSLSRPSPSPVVALGKKAPEKDCFSSSVTSCKKNSNMWPLEKNKFANFATTTNKTKQTNNLPT